MIVGPGFHYVTNVGADGAVSVDLLELTEDQHPHPLIAVSDSPDCCKAVAENVVTDQAAVSALVLTHGRAVGPGQKVYLAPGNYQPPVPEEPAP